MDVYTELKEIRRSIQAIELLQARNVASLEEHIRRTEILEIRTTKIDRDILKLKGFASIGGWILGIGATIVTILSRLSVIKW
jgi:hypothetical protein